MAGVRPPFAGPAFTGAGLLGPEPALSRRALALVIVLMMVLAGLEVAGLRVVRARLDRRHLVSQLDLAVAVQTFRPGDHPGLSRPVAPADLGRARSVRSDPSRCTPLSLLSTTTALDGVSWSGAAGTPLQPVLILGVRFADADQARQQIWLKRLALTSCSSVALTFPPFTKPAQTFGVRARSWPPSVWLDDRMAYALVGNGRHYEFYVRRYQNTVIWSYGDPDGVALRHGIVDSLAARLADLKS